MFGELVSATGDRPPTINSMKRSRIRLSVRVHGELRRDGHVIRYSYEAGEHTAWTVRDELVFEHLIELGSATPVAPRRRTKKEA